MDIKIPLNACEECHDKFRLYGSAQYDGKECMICGEPFYTEEGEEVLVSYVAEVDLKDLLCTMMSMIP